MDWFLHYSNTRMDGLTKLQQITGTSIIIQHLYFYIFERLISEGIHHHALLDHRQFPQRLQIFGLALHIYLFREY